MGRCFTIAPGGETRALKTLASITPSKFSDTEQSYIFQKNANAYEQYAENTYLINKGKVASGEWIDVVRFRDWLVDTIQKNMASLVRQVESLLMSVTAKATQSLGSVSLIQMQPTFLLISKLPELSISSLWRFWLAQSRWSKSKAHSPIATRANYGC